jgi:predicted ATPase
MITRLQVRNYRLLYVINQTLSPFQALIGANATGKSTFMDALGFLSDAIKAKDLREAIEVKDKGEISLGTLFGSIEL